VVVGGIIYGGRDSDTAVPVQQAFDWTHGIVTMGASLESEATAAVVGRAEGVRKFDLMSNMDFVAIPLGRYIQNNLEFGGRLAEPPAIFATNYYLRGPDGAYLNGMLDKHVWVKWAELRVHGDAEALEAPTGWIPRYDDLKRLFAEVRNRDYAPDDYAEQFKIRIPENLAKLERIEKIYRGVEDTPPVVFDALAAQRRRLRKLQRAKGDYVSPTKL
jgi:phosphoenolpyruvate carboxykinase (GTP)